MTTSTAPDADKYSIKECMGEICEGCELAGIRKKDTDWVREPHSQGSSLRVMFCTALEFRMRLYKSVCFAVKGQKTTSSIFSGSWNTI